VVEEPDRTQESKESPAAPVDWPRRLRRWTILYVVVPYLAVTLVFAALQRQLLYPAKTVAAIQPEDARLPAGQVHATVAVASDGLSLNGWLILAEGQSADSPSACDAQLAAGRPLILCFPGNSGNRLERVTDCRDFTAADCDVILFDYRGYGDNAGHPSERALSADARVVWNYVTQDRQVSPERVILFGESLGGAVATRLASELARDGIEPAGLILSSTFSSMSDVVAWHYPYLPLWCLLLDRYPSSDRIAEVTCPVIVLHGKRDDFVPIEFGRKLFAQAPGKSASGMEKRFIELGREGHNDVPRHLLREAVFALARPNDVVNTDTK